MKKLLTLLSVVGLTVTTGVTLVSCGPGEKTIIINEYPEINDINEETLLRSKTQSTNNEERFMRSISSIDGFDIGSMTFLEIKNMFPKEFGEYVNANIQLTEMHLKILIEENKRVWYNNLEEVNLVQIGLEPSDEDMRYIEDLFSDSRIPLLMNESANFKLLTNTQVNRLEIMINKFSSKYPDLDELEKFEINAKLGNFENDMMIFVTKMQKMAEVYVEEMENGDNVFGLIGIEDEFLRMYVNHFVDSTLYNANVLLTSKNYFIDNDKIEQKTEENINDQKQTAQNILKHIQNEFLNDEDFNKFIDEFRLKKLKTISDELKTFGENIKLTNGNELD